jgi:hypothetical protein
MQQPTSMSSRRDVEAAGSVGNAAAPVAVQEGTERRATVRLLRYWLSLRRTGIAPLFRDFDPRRNPVPWENCFLICVDPADRAVTFEHIGRGLRIGVPPIGVVAATAPELPSFLAELIAERDYVLATGTPAERDGRHILRDGREFLFRSILLPFLDLHQHPCYALGAVTYRIGDPPPGA